MKHFRQDEIDEVLTCFVDLKQVSLDELSGYIEFDAIYNDQRIIDRYNIKITANNPHSNHLPALYEIGNRTLNIAEKYGFKCLRDLHRNDDGTACVCIKQDELIKFPIGGRLIDYLEKLVVPYLYALSHFEIHQAWPWGEFSHYGIGLLEYYSYEAPKPSIDEIKEILMTIRNQKDWKSYHIQLKQPNPHSRCICGSGKPFASCHNLAFVGAAKLHAVISELRLKKSALFDRGYWNSVFKN